jgi:hypothetical protein
MTDLNASYPRPGIRYPDFPECGVLLFRGPLGLLWKLAYLQPDRPIILAGRSVFGLGPGSHYGTSHIASRYSIISHKAGEPSSSIIIAALITRMGISPSFRVSHPPAMVESTTPCQKWRIDSSVCNLLLFVYLNKEIESLGASHEFDSHKTTWSEALPSMSDGHDRNGRVWTGSDKEDVRVPSVWAHRKTKQGIKGSVEAAASRRPHFSNLDPSSFQTSASHRKAGARSSASPRGERPHGGMNIRGSCWATVRE